MALQNEDLRHEVERLRAENGALRSAIAGSVPITAPLGARGLYRNPPLALTEAERVALGANGLEHFPVWLAVLLHVLTFGIFSIVYYAGQGGRLPVVEADDPSPGKAVGLFLVPYFNLYWMFAFPTRLADRINLQLRLRGEAPMVSQGLVVASAISSVIFLVPVLWIFTVVQMQQAINRIVALGPVVPRAEPFAQQPAYAPPAAMTGVRVDLGPATETAAPAWPDESAWEADAAPRARRHDP
ncbi:MAG: hypothetical protein JWM10_4756 [Myxococcaceae bacterium]|nr:hypothetical protein [Myxococcaceae bacterium]